ATISTPISASWRTIAGCGSRRPTALAIEVRLLWIIRKIAATFNHQRATRGRLALDRRSHPAFDPSAALRCHLRALLFQNCLARRRLIARRHLHQPGVFHIDLHPGLLDD